MTGLQLYKNILLLILLINFNNCDSRREKNTNPLQRSLDYQSLESTPTPVGTPAYLGLGSYAKVFCTAVFASKRDPEEAFSNSRGLLLEEKYMPGVSYKIDHAAQKVTLFIADSVQRTAFYSGDQGCILVDGADGLQFEPVDVVSGLPDADEMPWPMGDNTAVISEEYDSDNFQAALDSAFNPRALTAALLVIHRGEIILEEYGNGAHSDMQLESWSMGKSLTTTLIGRLIQMGKLELDQLAPLKEWSRSGDPRGEITIRDLLQMSGGLMFSSHHDPEVSVPLAQLDHMYIYTGAVDVFGYAVHRPLEFIPGSTGRYRNCDPLTLGYIVRQTVESDGGNYWRWPQRELFDRIGIRRQLLETDPYGNFILTGYDYGTARNWGRLGLLYLQDGVWNGVRLLPEGFVDFVRTPAPGWENPEYGGQFWLNKVGTFDLPEDAYAMRGGGGQNTIIVPSLDLVVVRMGHSRGGAYAQSSLNAALRIIWDEIRE